MQHQQLRDLLLSKNMYTIYKDYLNTENDVRDMSRYELYCYTVNYRVDIDHETNWMRMQQISILKLAHAKAVKRFNKRLQRSEV